MKQAIKTYLKENEGSINFNIIIRGFDNLVTVRKGNQSKVYGYLEMEGDRVVGFEKM